MVSSELSTQNASAGTADVASVLRQSFIKCHRNLSKTQIDSEYSGTTCCTVLFLGNLLYTANSGDSRAILCSYSPSSAQKKEAGIVVKQVTRDHKPDLEDEAKRILSKNGRIDSFRDVKNKPIGPARVWLSHEDSPGLAMSRSIGD